MNGSSSSSSLPNGHAAAAAAEYTVQSFKPLLSKLLQHPAQYTPSDLHAALQHLASGQIAHAQTGSFLAALKMTEAWRRPEMVRVIVEVMRGLSGRVKVGGEGHVCDWTWTGQSCLNLLNVALPAAIVAAGAGCRVVKHGNASSPWPSTPSSGDILTALNVPTTTLPRYSLTKVAQSRHVPFLHIYVPRYSPRLTAISPLRRELGFETIFHSLASLISPAHRDYLVIGVHEERLGTVFAEGLKVLKAKRAWIVHSKANGLDCISPEAETFVWDLDGSTGEITTRTITPETFGCPSHPLSSVQLPSSSSSSYTSSYSDDISNPAASYSIHAQIISSLLSPRRLASSSPIPAPYEPDAYGTQATIDTSAVEDFVCLNAAALIYVSGKAGSEKEAFAMARRSLKEGKAYHALEALRDAASLSVDTDDRDLEGSDNEL